MKNIFKQNMVDGVLRFQKNMGCLCVDNLQGEKYET